jgi:[ribosomal protein S5]-alanine N-acetyltransferase
MFPSSIETARLLLRRPVVADAAEIYKNYASNPRVTRYMSWPVHRSLSDAERFLRELAEAVERNEQFSWAIVEQRSRWLCGMIGVMLQPPRAVFGYCLAEEVWGAGYASEAAAAIVPLVWQQPEIERLEAFCHTSHTRSARVLEKSGLRYVGVDRGHSMLPGLGPGRHDMLHYAVCRPKGLQAVAAVSAK